MKRKLAPEYDRELAKEASIALDNALAAMGNRFGKADPDAVAAHLLIHVQRHEVRERALQLALAWAARRTP